MIRRDRELFILKKMLLNIGMLFLAIGCVNYFLSGGSLFGIVLIVCSVILLLAVVIFLKVKREDECS